MTTNEKAEVIKLRKEGLGYLKISKLTGISRDTIKSFCQKTERLENKETAKCEYCGNKIDKSNRPAKRFCSDKCRSKWWNAHSDKQMNFSAVCPVCGHEFFMHRRNEKKYCSRPCYIAARFYGGILP